MPRDLFKEFGIDVPAREMSSWEPQSLPFDMHPEQNRTTLADLGRNLASIGVGAGQGALNVGANALNFLPEIYEKSMGQPLPKYLGAIPLGAHAEPYDIRRFAPNPTSEYMSEKFTEGGLPFLGAPGLKGAGLGARLLADMLAGSAESGNRMTGAIEGAAATPLKALAEWKAATPFTKSGATKRLKQGRGLLELLPEGTSGIPGELDLSLSRAFEDPLLKSSRRGIEDLLSKASKGGHQDVYALQSYLGDISRELANPKGSERFFFPVQTSAPERLLGRELGGLREKVKEAMFKNLENVGSKQSLDASDLIRKGMEDFRRYSEFKPYRNQAAYGVAAMVPGYHYLKNFIK